MLASLVLHDLSFDVLDLMAIMGVILVGTTPFLSYGALVAAFVNKTETAGIVYTFTLIPMVFFSAEACLPFQD